MDAFSRGETLTPSPDMFRLFADHLPHLAWISDEKGEICWSNRRWREFAGGSGAKGSWMALLGPDGAAAETAAAFRDALKDGRPFEAVTSLRGEDGSTRTFLTRVEPVDTGEGQPLHWLGTHTDLEEGLEPAGGRLQPSGGTRLDLEEKLRTEAERDRAEKALEEANRRFQAVLDNTLMAVFMMDERQHCVYANAAAEKLTGYSFAEMQGRPLHDVVHHKKPDGSHYPLEECPIDRAFPERAQMQGEELFVAPDGSFYPVAFTASPVLDPAGKPIGTVIEARNIAEEKERNAALQASEARFRTTAEALPGMLFVTDTTGANLYVNETYRLYTGRAGEEALGGDWMSIVHPDDRERVRKAVGESLASGGSFSQDYRIRRRDGVWRWHSTKAVATRSLDGEITGWIGVSIDIHDRYLAEQQARAAAEEMEAIYATAPVGLALLDRDLRYVRVNERLADMNGVAAADHVGRFVADIMPGFGSEIQARLDRVLAGEEIWGLEVSGESAGAAGTTGFWRQNWLPVRGADGEVTGVAVSAEDVTDEREAEARRREAEQRYRTVFNSAAVGIGRVSPDGPFLEINDRFCEILGRSREEILGGGWAEITHPDDVGRDLALAGQALAGEIDNYTLEKRYIGKDGRDIWVNLTVSAERDGDGKVKFFIAVVEDIGERKAAEEALRRSEERYRTLFNSMEQGFCVLEVLFENERPTDYRFVEINPAFSRQSGLPESVLHRTIKEAVPNIEPVWFERYGEVARSGTSQRFIEHSEPLGRWFEVYAFRIGEEKDRTVAILFSDVTERIRQEEALRDSERELRLRLDAIPQMVWSTRPDGYHDFYNDRWYQFTGVPPGSTDGEVWNGMFHPDDQARAFERWDRSLQTGEPYEIEYRLRHRDGGYRWVLGRALPIRNREGEIVRWMGTCTDINDRIAANRALQESEARLRAVIEAAPVGLVFADPTGRITGGNSRVEALLGHPVLPSPDVASYREWVSFHSDGRRVEGHEYPLAKIISGEAEQAEIDVEYLRGDGRRSWMRFSASAIRGEGGDLLGGVVASIDIDRERRLTESLEREVEKVVAEREAAQEALRQSQKLEAMGQLTGGVAHDFNNLLTPIIGSLDLLQRKQILDDRTGRLVEGALASAEKARTLVQRLLAFARRQPLQPQAIDLGGVVTEMSELIASTSGPRIKVEVDLPDDLPPALADGNQLEMALLNLAVNARDAMPEGGRLVIAARQSAAADAPGLGLGPEPHVVLSVSDTGVGMDEETRRRAVEPFFSTKGIGKGTGLGLSMVHGLAAQLGGALNVRSVPGMGTTVELWLPVAAGRAAVEPPHHAEAERQGAGTVLLVDDEELVRASTASMLGDLGYSVVEAGSGEEACRLVGEGLKPDLLITDQLMPGLSGTDLAVRLRAEQPELPVLIVSGYADLESLSPLFPHLSKPFRLAELAAALDRMANQD